MSRKFKNRPGDNMKPLIRSKDDKAYTPPPEPPNLAAKFMRENRGGIPDEDTPAMTLDGALVEPKAPVAAVAETPAPVAAPSDTPGGIVSKADEPVAAAPDLPADPVVPAGVSGGSGDVPPATPVATEPVTAQAAAAAPAPARNEYDPAEEIALLEGEQKWKRSDIVLGLRERATQAEELQRLRPAVAERDALLKSFGAPDTKTAMAFVEPFVKAIKENPARGTLLDQVAAMDPATINYVTQLLEDWKQLPVDQRSQFGQVGPAAPAQQPADPRYESLSRNHQAIEIELLNARRDREVGMLNRDWPFVRNDQRTWDALRQVADMLWKEDEAKGIPPLQRRGLVEAIEQQRPFLEAMKTANERRVMAAATAAANPTPATLGQPPSTSAILPATHPEPPVSARPPQLKGYRGPVDGAAAAFLADQGYTK